MTLHLWVWYPNPAGLYHGTNPYIQPFNTPDTQPFNHNYNRE